MTSLTVEPFSQRQLALDAPAHCIDRIAQGLAQSDGHLSQLRLRLGITAQGLPGNIQQLRRAGDPLTDRLGRTGSRIEPGRMINPFSKNYLTYNQF